MYKYESTHSAHCQHNMIATHRAHWVRLHIYSIFSWLETRDFILLRVSPVFKPIIRTTLFVQYIHLDTIKRHLFDQTYANIHSKGIPRALPYALGYERERSKSTKSEKREKQKQQMRPEIAGRVQHIYRQNVEKKSTIAERERVCERERNNVVECHHFILCLICQIISFNIIITMCEFLYETIFDIAIYYTIWHVCGVCICE